MGSQEYPIYDELTVISHRRAFLKKFVIFIEDIRLCLPGSLNGESSISVDKLVDWARSENLAWRISHDIMIVTNDVSRLIGDNGNRA